VSAPRKRVRGLPAQIGDSVSRELARLGQAPAGSAGLAALVSAWPAAVGEAIARNAWPARVTRDGTLLVHTSSSTWAFELGMLQESVRSSLGELAPPRLRFVVGPVPEPGAGTPPQREPNKERSLHEVPGHAVARGAEMAREIEDPDLREAVARVAAASLAAAARRGGPTGPSDTLHR
jgi:hypothetical protein